MPKVGLDIGHGNNTYPPSKGVPGMPEFEFNNAVGKYAKPLLESYGIEVVMAQPFDSRDVGSARRISTYNNANVDLVMSIHADWNNNAAARGFWAFHWHTSRNGLRLAQLWSKHLDKTPMRFRSIQASRLNHWSNFFILRETNAPAVLMEHGFMSNASDLKMLKSDRYRRQCATALADAAAEYFGIDKPAPSFDGLQRGDKGADVGKLQSLLIEAGFELPRFGVDRDFGGETESAVKDAQRAFNFTVTGKASQAFINRLKEVVKIMGRVFKDVPDGHWAEKDIEKLKDDGIMEGFEDDTFRGDDNVTRYQLAAVLGRLLDK